MIPVEKKKKKNFLWWFRTFFTFTNIYFRIHTGIAVLLIGHVTKSGDIPSIKFSIAVIWREFCFNFIPSIEISLSFQLWSSCTCWVQEFYLYCNEQLKIILWKIFIEESSLKKFFQKLLWKNFIEENSLKKLLWRNFFEETSSFLHDFSSL